MHFAIFKMIEIEQSVACDVNVLDQYKLQGSFETAFVTKLSRKFFPWLARDVSDFKH